MDRTEKLEYEKGIEQYFDDHKVYDLFEKLFKELIINKPENPIDYLIERLKRKEVKGSSLLVIPVQIEKVLVYL